MLDDKTIFLHLITIKIKEQCYSNKLWFKKVLRILSLAEGWDLLDFYSASRNLLILGLIWNRNMKC